MSPAVEALAPYQGQTHCDAVARPGVAAFRDLVLQTYPGTAGASEHNEGWAWDWRVNTANTTQVAQVEDLMTWLLATDDHDNTMSMARRLGVRCMTWNSRMQPHTGASPHDMGQVAPVIYVPVPPSPTASATPTPTASRSATPAPRTSPSASAGPRPCAVPAPGVTPSADASLLATPTPSASPGPSPVVDAHLDQRRATVGSMPGPWRRH